MKRMTFAATAALAMTFVMTFAKTANAQWLSNPNQAADGSQAANAWGNPSQNPWAVFNLTITDLDGTPIEGAEVMIGEDANIPFYGNVLTTDHDGHVAIPQTWRDPQPVTITAQGFVKATYLSLAPGIQTLKVRRASESIVSSSRFELKGNSSGFGNLKNDGVFDLGLVVQAIPRAQISTMSLQSLISPETDHFTVLGQSVDLPSNITIPDQTESYYFPLHFAKPTYRLYLPQNGAWQIAALHARVPFKATIDALQSGKSMIDIINSFDFREGSITPVNLTQNSTTLDLAVNQTQYVKNLKFTAPAYDASLNLLTISLANSNGSYYPTDIKNATPGATVQMSAPANSQDGMILAAFRKANAKATGAEVDQYSAVTLPNSEQRPFDPLRLVNPPQANADQLVLDTPTAPTELTPVMTYGVFSMVTLVTQGHLQMETKQPLWDVWAPSWVQKLDLPKQTPPTPGANQKLRWEVGFDAQFTGQTRVPPGPDALEKITHVTRSAVDL